eukprot:628202-Prymnesium_polylepis.1
MVARCVPDDCLSAGVAPPATPRGGGRAASAAGRRATPQRPRRGCGWWPRRPRRAWRACGGQAARGAPQADAAALLL